MSYKKLVNVFKDCELRKLEYIKHEKVFPKRRFFVDIDAAEKAGILRKDKKCCDVAFASELNSKCILILIEKKGKRQSYDEISGQFSSTIRQMESKNIFVNPNNIELSLVLYSKIGPRGQFKKRLRENNGVKISIGNSVKDVLVSHVKINNEEKSGPMWSKARKVAKSF